MKKELVIKLHKNFEDYVHIDEDGTEFWYARELQELLDYKEWRNFVKVIEKAKEACKNSKQDVNDHFVDANKTIEMPKNAVKIIDDIKLTRYAAYLIAQNGDPKKDVIAFAQTYFAIQTRKQELIEQRLLEMERLQARQKLTDSDKMLGQVIFEKGIDGKGIGRIKSQGDHALFGGYNTDAMKKRLGIEDEKQPLADVLPTITIKAKDFANEITAFNVKEHNLENEYKISGEHIKNNEDVRKVLTDRNIYPENLPPEEDIKKVAKRLKSETKKINNKSSKKLTDK